MMEPVFLAGFMALLYFTILFRDTQSVGAVIGAALASLAASLSRYDAWFAIPFVALYFLVAARRRKLVMVGIFGMIAALGPLYWLAHEWGLYNYALAVFDAR